jgi:hypothetical protein
VTQIRGAAERLPAGITAYFEIPIAGDPAGLVSAIAEVGGRAKVRTGGETADLFPGPRDLGRFMQACAEEQVPFKATAGLHHPVRSLHKLTSEPGSDSIVMHGFLNVFIAAALLRSKISPPSPLNSRMGSPDGKTKNSTSSRSSTPARTWPSGSDRAPSTSPSPI